MTGSYLFLNTTIAFCLVKYLFQIDGDNLGVLAANKDLTLVFISQISQFEKFRALHKLISIVLQLTNQIKYNSNQIESTFQGDHL